MKCLKYGKIKGCNLVHFYLNKSYFEMYSFVRGCDEIIMLNSTLKVTSWEARTDNCFLICTVGLLDGIAYIHILFISYVRWKRFGIQEISLLWFYKYWKCIWSVIAETLWEF